MIDVKKCHGHIYISIRNSLSVFVNKLKFRGRRPEEFREYQTKNLKQRELSQLHEKMIIYLILLFILK